MADELAGVLWPDDGEAREYHTRGKVQGVSGGKVDVLLRGAQAATPCGKLAGCEPKAGDIALVLVMPSGCVVLGVLG